MYTGRLPMVLVPVTAISERPGRQPSCTMTTTWGSALVDESHINNNGTSTVIHYTHRLLRASDVHSTFSIQSMF